MHLTATPAAYKERTTQSYQDLPDTLTFTTSDWNTPQTISVSATDDGEVSTDRYASITHAVSGGDYDGMKLEVPSTKTHALEDARASEADLH